MEMMMIKGRFLRFFLKNDLGITVEPLQSKYAILNTENICLD